MDNSRKGVRRLALTAASAIVLLLSQSGLAQTEIITATNNDVPWGGIGLGFQVGLTDWPAIAQRGYMDELTADSFGSHEVRTINATFDAGQICTGTSPATPGIVEQNWCYRKYTLGSGGETLALWVSRVSPALLLQTSNLTLDLFSGTKPVGDRWNGSDWVFGTTSARVPTYCAYMSGGNVVVAQTNQVINLSGMGECWMLFWHGNATDWLRCNYATLPWGTPAFNEALTGSFFTKADMPILVVFQEKPTQIGPGGDNALRVTFPSPGAGYVSVLPPFGAYHPDASVTQGWYSSFPTDVKTRCQTWSKRMKWFPTNTNESYSIVGTGSTVNLIHSFNYINLTTDDWGTVAEKIVPVPPAAVLADTYGMLPISFSGALLGMAIPTHSGPYTGISGAATSQVTTTITGLNTYVDYMVASPAASGSDATDLAGETQALVSDMITAGPLAPGYGRGQSSRYEMHFALMGDLFTTLGEAYPYLDSSTKTNAYNYATSEYNRQNPFTISTFQANPSGTARREYFNMVSDAVYLDIVGQGLYSTSVKIIGQTQANTTYGVWAICKAANDWTLANTAWTNIKSKGDTAAKGADWANMGLRKGTAGSSADDYTGGAGHCNARFARNIGHARIAHYKTDATEEQKAVYRLARAAINLYAAGKMVEYLYAENIVRITGSATWLADLTTDSDSGGGGQLWTDNWDAYDEDVRTVVGWNEYGPRIHYMAGGEFLGVTAGDWQPGLVRFENLSPEVARFRKTYLQTEDQRYYDRVNTVCPYWHVNNAESVLGKENSQNSLMNTYSTFMGKVYVLDGTFSDVLSRYDTAHFKHGDLYQIRRLVANLRCQGTGLSWVLAQ